MGVSMSLPAAAIAWGKATVEGARWSHELQAVSDAVVWILHALCAMRHGGEAARAMAGVRL